MQNPVSIHIRIIDPDFQGLESVDRETEIWHILSKLPDEVFLNITMFLLLTPKEVKNFLASKLFDDPFIVDNYRRSYENSTNRANCIYFR
ncbi:hypothetical protein GMMP15_440021 [Candidatus Magnetomoraceae bacterium gMMP-15]